jgi:hypothetical protein
MWKPDMRSFNALHEACSCWPENSVHIKEYNLTAVLAVSSLKPVFCWFCFACCAKARIVWVRASIPIFYYFLTLFIDLIVCPRPADHQRAICCKNNAICRHAALYIALNSYVYIYICMCVCLCVSDIYIWYNYNNIYIYYNIIYIYIVHYIYIHIYDYIRIAICICWTCRIAGLELHIGRCAPQLGAPGPPGVSPRPLWGLPHMAMWPNTNLLEGNTENIENENLNLTPLCSEVWHQC